MSTFSTALVVIPSPHTHEDEISLVQQEICSVDNSIRELYKTRAGLYRRLNDLQSKTCKFPPEILSLIFQKACASPKIDYHPDLFRHRSATTQFVLGQVCSSWRQVAWSTPQLWSTFTASLDDKNTECIANTLDTFRTNVACVPFSLYLDFECMDGGLDGVIEGIFREDLGSKIHTLHLQYLGSSWSTFFSNLRHLPNLSDLRIHDDHDFEYLLSDVPSLQKLSIDIIEVSMKLSSDMLTELDIAWVSVGACARLLAQSQNLVTLCAFFIECTCIDIHNPNDYQVSLKCLEDFSWQPYDDSPCIMSLLHCIKTPSLRSFSFDSRYTDVPLTLPVTLPNIPNGLTSLSLRCIGACDDEVVEDVMKWLPRLEHLCFYGCNKSVLQKFLQKLRWSNDQHYLPALQTLTISDYYQPHPCYWTKACNPSQYCSVNAEDILEVVECRFTKGVCTNFRFMLQTKKIDFVEEATLNKLRGLVTRGFDFEVVSFDGIKLLDLSGVGAR